jgi:hypothetical protein
MNYFLLNQQDKTYHQARLSTITHDPVQVIGFVIEQMQFRGNNFYSLQSILKQYNSQTKNMEGRSHGLEMTGMRKR